MEKLSLKSLLGEASNIKMQNGKLVAGSSDSDQEIVLKFAKRAYEKIGQTLENKMDDLELKRRALLKDIAIMDNVDQQLIDSKVEQFVSFGVELAILKRKQESYNEDSETFKSSEK